MVLRRVEEWTLCILISICLSLVNCSRDASSVCVNTDVPPQMTSKASGYDIYFVAKSTNGLEQSPAEGNVDKSLLRLECKAVGDPFPIYSWRKNGKAYKPNDTRVVREDGKGDLIFLSMKSADTGEYQCFAENRWGVASSSPVLLHAWEYEQQLELSSNLQRVTKAEGDSFFLSCLPPLVASEKPFFRWMLEFQNENDKSLGIIKSPRVTMDPAGRLIFSNVNFEDGGPNFTYVCVMSHVSSLGGQTEKIGIQYQLNVERNGIVKPVKPQLQYVSNTNPVVQRGASIDMWCVFKGMPMPQIRWQRQHGRFDTSRIELLHFGRRLRIKNATVSDEGVYVCNGINLEGSAQQQFRLGVIDPMDLQIHPKFQVASRGKSVSIHCGRVQKSQFNVTWMFNGKIMQMTHKHTENPRWRVTPRTLYISNSSKSDTGSYACNITYPGGFIYQDAVVKVVDDIANCNDVYVTFEGKNVSLDCQNSNAYKSSVQLREPSVVDNLDYHGLDANGSLYLESVQVSHSGLYRCDKNDATRGRYVNVVVLPSFAIHSQHVFLEHKHGESALLHCEVDNYQKINLKIRWFKNFKAISPTLDTRIRAFRNNSLQIDDLTMSDTGTYICIVSSKFKTMSTFASLRVKPFAEGSQSPLLECGSSLVTMSWPVIFDSRGNKFDHVTVSYSDMFQPHLWKAGCVDVAINGGKCLLRVTPWVNYTFAITRNARKVGPSERGLDVQTCQSQPDIPYKNPGQVNIQRREDATVVVTWSAMSARDRNGPGYKYLLKWKQSENSREWRVKSINDWRVSQFSFGRLPIIEILYVIIIAVNDIGVSSLAHVAVPQSFSETSIHSGQPTNFQLVEKLGMTTAVFCWDPPVPAQNYVNGMRNGYKVQIWNDGAESTREVFVAKNDTCAVIDTLFPCSVNFVRLVLYTDNSTLVRNTSHIIQVLMNGTSGEEAALSSLIVKPLGPNTMHLVWEKPSCMNNSSPRYAVYYKVLATPLVADADNSSLWTQAFVNLRGNSVEVPGLLEDTAYEFLVETVSMSGISYKSLVRAKTPPKCLIPSQTESTFKWAAKTTQNCKNSTVEIEVLPCKSTQNQPSDFLVQYKLSRDKYFASIKLGRQELTTLVEGLDCKNIYTFRLVSILNGVVSYSLNKEVSFETRPGQTLTSTYLMRNLGKLCLVILLLSSACLTSVVCLMCVFRSQGNANSDTYLTETDTILTHTEYTDSTNYHHDEYDDLALDNVPLQQHATFTD